MGGEFSVSVSYDENTAENHARRDYTPASAERSLEDRNVTIIACDDCRSAFDDFFQPSIDRYNARQTRGDRKKLFPSYIRALEDGTEGYGAGAKHEKPLYQYVLQIGNRSDNGITDSAFDDKHWRDLKQDEKYREASEYVQKHLNRSEEREKLRSVLVGVGEKLQTRYPNFKIFQLVLHDDEPNGTAHLDMIGTFFTSGEKTGLDTRVSQTKALRAMGFKATDGEQAINLWRRDVMLFIQEEMEANGYQRKFMDDHSKHVSVGSFRADQELRKREEELDSRADMYIDIMYKIDAEKNQVEEVLSGAKKEAEEIKHKAETEAKAIREQSEQYAAQAEQARAIATAKALKELEEKKQELEEQEEDLKKRKKDFEAKESALRERETVLETITKDVEAKSQAAINEAYFEAKREVIEPKIQCLYDLEAQYRLLIDSQKQLSPEPEASLVEFCKNQKIGNKSVYGLYQEHLQQSDPSDKQRQANRAMATELNKQIEDAKDVKQADPVNDPAVKKIIRRAIAEHVHIRRTPDISSADAIDQNDNEELEMI